MKDEDALKSKALRDQRLCRQVQDTVPFVTGNRDVLTCLVCGYVCIMPIEDTVVTNEKNALVLAEYEANIRR